MAIFRKLQKPDVTKNPLVLAMGSISNVQWNLKKGNHNMPCTVNKLFEEFIPYHYQSLLLRAIQESDMEYMNDMFDMPLNENTLRLFAMNVANAYRKQKTLEIAVENSEHEFVGIVDIYDIHDSICEIGYRMCKKQRNKGYAKKAVEAVLTLLKGHGMTCVRARSEIENIASECVLKANGFVSEKEKDNIRYWEVQL